MRWIVGCKNIELGDDKKVNYETENLYLAAALLTAGKKLTKPYRNGNSKIIFSFDDSEKDIQELVERFFSSELCLPVNLFANHWRDLRKLIDTL